MKLDLNTRYYLILIDIIRSSKLNEETRGILFTDLKKRLEDLNRNLSPAPVLKLSINYGDEIVGLFSSPIHFYSIIESLRTLFPGEKSFRFVACTGRIGFVSEDITQVGGEIFKHAGELMAQLKKDKSFCEWSLEDPVLNQALNALTETSNYLYERMRPGMREILSRVREEEVQKNIAEKLSRKASSISRSKKRGGIDFVLEADKAVHSLLGKHYPLEQ